MISIKSLQGISMDVLYDAFNDAFQEYPRNWTRNEWEDMLRRRGFDPAISFGAFESDILVSFIFNASGIYRGRLSSYDTGTGTRKAYRKQGISTNIFNHSIPFFKEQGIKSYVLEVISTNSSAISLYQGLGFTTDRELHYFLGVQNENHKPEINLPEGYKIIELKSFNKMELESMWDFEPSWQNNWESVLRAEEKLYRCGAYHKDKLVAYGMIEGHTGDIPQLAVHKNHRRKGIGSAIMQQLKSYSSNGIYKVTNTEAKLDYITAFLEKLDFVQMGSQFEMRLDF